jgi:hypothetical protein
MDNEEDIKMAAEKIMKDTKVSKLDVLNMLLGRYQSQRVNIFVYLRRTQHKKQLSLRI